MRNFKRYTFVTAVILLSLIVSLHTSAQAKKRITGTVIDSSGKPLNLVTVKLFRQKDPVNPLQVTLSKDNGSYSFNKPDTGTYSLTFSHTGFALKKQQLNITASAEDVDAGPAKLVVATGTLKEVNINVQRPLVEQSDDKIIFNAEDDPATKSETAIDVLRKTPFVSVDGEDNVKVNGKSNFKVLLNGRETSMFARNIKEALRGFPGSAISKIEVITSPSAKYDGEGIGGLINIITKKKIVGYNGNVSSFTRTLDKLQSFNINGNAKFGKVGISLFLSTGDANPTKVESSTITVPSTPSVFARRALTGNKMNGWGWSFGNAELSWEVDSLNTLSVYSNINSNSNRSAQTQTITTNYNNSPKTVSYYNLTNRNNNPGISVGTDYIKKFKSNKAKEFTIRFFGEFGKSDSHVESTQDNPGTDRYINNNSNAVNNQYTLQSDYILPLKGTGKLETGLKAIMRRATSDFESLVKYDPSADYKLNPLNTDHFKYSQDVLSAYTMYGFKIKKSSLRFGTRVEHTTVDGNFISSNTVVKQSYTTVLPNVQFTTKLSKALTLVLAYTKRLQRPYITDLNPFVFNNDSLNISSGNPDLGPQIIHSLTAQTRLLKGSIFAAVNMEASYSDNKILDYAIFDPSTGITKTTSLNLGKEFLSSLGININGSFAQKWNMFLNSTLRFSKVTNRLKKDESNQGFGISFNTNISYKITKKFTASTFFGMWKDPVTIQTTYPFSTWYNIALAHKFLKDKLNVSLRLINYLEKTREYKTIVRDPYFTTTNVDKQIRRGGAMALTWSFGKLKENVSKKKGVTNDDLLNKTTPTTGGN